MIKTTVFTSICALWIANSSSAAILNPAPPPGGKEIAYSQFKGIVEHPGVLLGRGPEFLHMPLKEMSLSEPYQSYQADTSKLSAGRLLSNAQAVFWIYPVLRNQKAVAEVGLSASEKMGPILACERIDEGHYADATLAALRKANKFPQVKAKNYQLRRLWIPSIHVVAVWLQRDSEDILIPLAPVPQGLTADQVYSEAEMAPILESILEHAIKAWKNVKP